ncbi:hypothetical protein FRAAL3414 [Frankia alni ACN14a]|uniref:Uncharacterized protein n=1 Tax=Frankia alni (strain DSM 45986 / CECT 9034 / ACN14a) TaxID=326424 RepID=Q0RKA0_FRAAA|nr:hypothetical protein FRAAL3414 [Frankia alni ACN14a]
MGFPLSRAGRVQAGCRGSRRAGGAARRSGRQATRARLGVRLGCVTTPVLGANIPQDDYASEHVFDIRLVLV